MHLFNLSQFSDRFGIDLSVGDFNEAVVEASKAATASIAAYLRYGDFNPFTARKDTFFVRRSFDAGTGQSVKMRLSRGFIDSTTGFSAQYSASPVNFRNNDLGAITDLQNVSEDGASDYLFIDADRGILTAYGVDLTDQWVQITYNGGLTIATDDEYEGVPEWLGEAAQLAAAIHLSRNRALATEGDDISPLKAALKDVTSGNWRTDPSATLPTSTEV